jgi:beta-lactamase regulating signal transducer with metallopeptidase domain/HAMP domain-containing protein
MLLVALWLLGSLTWFTVAVRRLYRFHRLVRESNSCNNDVQERAGAVAGKLGASRCPPVAMVSANLPPMLIGFPGRARLLLPARLWGALSLDQQETVLVHELAHWHRCDHWVRMLEMLVLGLYWWHPAAWRARRRLRELEEECCDAWVVWALPNSARSYAAALIDTAAYLSHSRPILPLTASGIGEVHSMRRRLTMIMTGRTPRTLSTGGALAVLLTGALTLPMWPTWAHTEPPAANGQENATTPQQEAARDASGPIRATTAANVLGAIADPLQAPASETTAPSVLKAGGGTVRPEPRFDSPAEKLRDEIELMEVQLGVKRAEMGALEQQLNTSVQNLRRAEVLNKQKAISITELDAKKDEVERLKNQLIIKQAELKEPEVRLKQARRKLSQLKVARADFERQAGIRSTAALSGTGAASYPSSSGLVGSVQLGQQDSSASRTFPPARTEMDVMKRRLLELESRLRQKDEEAQVLRAKVEYLEKQLHPGSAGSASTTRALNAIRPAEPTAETPLNKIPVAGRLYANSRATGEERIQTLEKAVNTLVNELQALREELHGKKEVPSLKGQ